MKYQRRHNFSGFGELTGNQYNRIRNTCKQRRLAFKVTPKYLWHLFLKQDRKCKLSGVPLSFARVYSGRGSGETTASPDRIDSSKGYIPGNVQWVHKDINSMKGKRRDKEFINWCKLVAKNSCYPTH